MLRQDYAPAPVVPKYPPLRGFGYRLPIVPESELAVERSGTFGFAQIEQGAKQFSDELRRKALQQLLAGKAVQFDPLSGIQPETEAERLGGRTQPTIRQGPLHQSIRERLGPLGRSNLGDVGIGDFIPGADVAFAVDDLASIMAREQAGLDVGVGEKVGAVMGVPLAVIGLGRLSKAGGELFDRVARRLGQKPEPSIFEKLAKEGIPVSQNIAEGKAAIDKALKEQTSVPAAMYRSDVGEITMDFGVAGDPQRDFSAGYGLSHIIARRNSQGQNGEFFVREIVPQVLAKGELYRLKTSPNGDRRAEIVYQGSVVVLSLFRQEKRETWVLTGFRDRRFK
jgi:hypothetical protein